jgi:hypothetical protein
MTLTLRLAPRDHAGIMTGRCRPAPRISTAQTERIGAVTLVGSRIWAGLVDFVLLLVYPRSRAEQSAIRRTTRMSTGGQR